MCLSGNCTVLFANLLMAVMGIEGQVGAGAATITAGVKPTKTAAETTTLRNHSERPRATNTCTRKL
jgi:hypothetical protein